jgi:hypothetical protein
MPEGSTPSRHYESLGPAPRSARLPLARLCVSVTSHLHMTQSSGPSWQRRKTFEELALERLLASPRVRLRKPGRMAQQPRAPAPRTPRPEGVASCSGAAPERGGLRRLRGSGKGN